MMNLVAAPEWSTEHSYHDLVNKHADGGAHGRIGGELEKPSSRVLERKR
jgi:hypothetical protein